MQRMQARAQAEEWQEAFVLLTSMEGLVRWASVKRLSQLTCDRQVEWHQVVWQFYGMCQVSCRINTGEHNR